MFGWIISTRGEEKKKWLRLEKKPVRYEEGHMWLPVSWMDAQEGATRLTAEQVKTVYRILHLYGVEVELHGLPEPTANFLCETE